MQKGFKAMTAEANAAIETLDVADARALVGRDDVALIDVRDGHEVRSSGMLPGATHASRGLLEFLIDPECPMHNPIFSEPKRFVFYCGTGGRSALATKLARDMGLSNVAHVGGGFKAWIIADGEVEPWSDDC
jgi:rhodanese-related sulfurtransferase